MVLLGKRRGIIRRGAIKVGKQRKSLGRMGMMGMGETVWLVVGIVLGLLV